MLQYFNKKCGDFEQAVRFNHYFCGGKKSQVLKIKVTFVYFCFCWFLKKIIDAL